MAGSSKKTPIMCRPDVMPKIDAIALSVYDDLLNAKIPSLKLSVAIKTSIPLSCKSLNIRPALIACSCLPSPTKTTFRFFSLAI